MGAYLTALRRTRVGPWDVEGAVPSLDLDPGRALADAWIDPVDALGHLPRVDVGTEEVRRLATGQWIEAPSDVTEPAGPVVVVREGGLVAVATVSGGTLRPRKVFARP